MSDFTVLETAEFSDWLNELADKIGRAKIARRVDRMRRGNFGDNKPVGDGVSEMRIAGNGPGYRVYFVRRETSCVVLLCGGGKDRQRQDIERAKLLAREF